MIHTLYIGLLYCFPKYMKFALGNSRLNNFLVFLLFTVCLFIPSFRSGPKHIFNSITWYSAQPFLESKSVLPGENGIGPFVADECPVGNKNGDHLQTSNLGLTGSKSKRGENKKLPVEFIGFESTPKASEKAFSNIASEMVVGGSRAEQNRFPYMVNLYKGDGFPRYPFCGASLVHESFVLTAAHCVEGVTPEVIQLGKLDLRKEYVGVELFKPVSVTIHPLRNRGTRSHDVALIELDGKSKFKPVVLADDIYNLDTLEQEGLRRTASVLGWGWKKTIGENKESAILKQASLNIIDHDDCRSRWQQYMKENYPDHVFVDLTEGHVLCAFGDGERAGCKGDSGGALIIEKENLQHLYQSEFVYNDILVGVVSFGAEECVHPYVPGVYMSTHYHRTWIQATIGSKLGIDSFTLPNLYSDLGTVVRVGGITRLIAASGLGLLLVGGSFAAAFRLGRMNAAEAVVPVDEVGDNAGLPVRRNDAENEETGTELRQPAQAELEEAEFQQAVQLNHGRDI